MLTVRDFYARSRWRDQWNVLRPDGSRHRGHDIACGTHEDIPALRGGTVVVVSRSSVLGHFVVVQSGTDFDYYCHLLAGSLPAPNAAVSAGTRIGRAAGPDDEHGSAWRGVHLHFGSGARSTSVTTGATHDATAIVRGVLGTARAGFAGLAVLQRSKGQRMLLTMDTAGTGWIVTADGFGGLASPQIYHLFYRLINSDQTRSVFVNGVKPENFLRAEVDIMDRQLKLLAKANATGQTIDPVKLAAALSDALGKEVSATLPPAALEKLDAIEAGVDGIVLTPEDFEPESPVSIEELAQAFEIAVPRVNAALERNALEGVPILAPE
jgi:hypothetical protein